MSLRQWSIKSYSYIDLMSQRQSMLRKVWLLLLGIGPGIFAIGYTIGTGSVTSMIVAGSSYGMELLWVLVLSCFFSWVLMEAYGRYALVTGESALYAFRKHLRFGSLMAILIIAGITIGQWNSLIGIMGISANAIFEIIGLFFPAIQGYESLAVLVIAIVIISVMYRILWIGKYAIFEKILVLFVTLMGVSFLASLFVVMPPAGEIIGGLAPSIPQVEGGKMLVAAFVGTTMAAATFISRPLFIQGKGWTIEQAGKQRRDALWAAILIFLISASIMAAATGALFYDGKVVTRVLDMVYALEPVAGRFAIAIFILGTLSAGLSSVFPILMITPLMISDFKSGKLDTSSTQFKVLAGAACLVGLCVPVLGANPIKAQILTQVFNVFVLPLVIIGIILLVNNGKLMGEHRAGWVLNTGMILALIFAGIISYNGAVAIIENFD